MGSAAAAELAHRGERVLGLEQFPFVHELGSSHGATRIIRLAYFEHPDYVPLLRRAYQRWRELEAELNASLLTECGVLSLGLPRSEMIAGIEHSATLHQLAVEHYSAADLAREYPQWRVPREWVGRLERCGGFLRVEDCVRGHLEIAARHGAELRAAEPVISWQADANSVRVTTARGEYAAARLVITAGPWAARVLAELKLPLTLMRQVTCWFDAVPSGEFAPARFPCYFTGTPYGDFYGFPAIDAAGAKVARHYGGSEHHDPTEIDRAVSAADEAPLTAFLGEYLPGIRGPVRKSSVCIYTLTPDRHFAIDRHPEFPQVVYAAGFSGHGFKFASVIGEILADLALSGGSALPLAMFRAARFVS